jgi:hypothetical protein
VGVGWQLPWALRAEASVELVVMLDCDGQQLTGRTDFASSGLVSPHHSATLFVDRWTALGHHWEAAYTLLEQDTLGVEVTWQPADESLPPRPIAADVGARPAVTLTIALTGKRQPARVDGNSPPRPTAGTSDDDDHSDDLVGWVDIGVPYGRWELMLARGEEAPVSTTTGVLQTDALTDDHAGPAGEATTAVSARIQVGAADEGAVRAVARCRSTSGKWEDDRRGPRGAWLASQVTTAIERARAADDALWRGAARLEADWPAAWRRGWVYDAETTRMCVYPPGGIFHDVWPAWMVQWPRAVVAEGTLDMARFAYASPELALRATLSLFRDAAAPNVPCVFQHGEPNMVAADGSICGTSPAWCIPFFNLERLYAMTLDREWLAAIYPNLARYVEWWLQERTDADGWAVYKCTWEAGEDDTPRLDPERRGDNVVSAFVRPVELQATMALSAGVLARFALALDNPDDARRWRAVESEFRQRTRELWDPQEGRFRDWDARTGRFLAPAGESNYWGIDPCRYSALAFTPVLAGLLDAEIVAGLSRELREYPGPPWTLWASWSYVVLEAAVALGERAFAGRVAAEIVDRVYAEIDAREPGGAAHPTPGVAREYWPLDLDNWASCEGYGWGANTASLLVRQIFGFFEGPYVDETIADRDRGPSADAASVVGAASTSSGGWRATYLLFDLRPALPERFLTPDSEYRLAGIPYRGARLTIGYRVAVTDGPNGLRATDGIDPDPLTITVAAEVPTRCRIVSQSDRGERQIYASGQPDRQHEIAGRNGDAYTVELWPDG